MIEGDIRRDMTVDNDQKYQEKFEAAAKMLFQLKQIDHLNKVHGDMAIPSVEKVLHVSSYPLLEPMGFYTDISDGVTKMRAATPLGYIARIHQRTKSAELCPHKLKVWAYSFNTSF